jgi:hypothetical protein
MTRKDYELIALAARKYGDYIRECMASGTNDHLAELNTERLRASESILNFISLGLETDNPRFDRVKFLTACGIE